MYVPSINFVMWLYNVCVQAELCIIAQTLLNFWGQSSCITSSISNCSWMYPCRLIITISISNAIATFFYHYLKLLFFLGHDSQFKEKGCAPNNYIWYSHLTCPFSTASWSGVLPSEFLSKKTASLNSLLQSIWKYKVLLCVLIKI